MEGFEWDEEKCRANLDEHGVDFIDAIYIFEGPCVYQPDRRKEYGEDRHVALGETNGHVLAVVFTMRGEMCRIISARKARRDERNAYFAALAAKAPDG